MTKKIKSQKKASKNTQPSLVDKMMDYESGALSEQDTIRFFQELVDKGMAFILQGSYGRTASALIQAGLVKIK